MSLSSRMDNRTPEQFAAQLREGHQVEDLLGEAFRLQLELNYNSTVAIENVGVDNTGAVIDGNLPFHDVDKKFIWGTQSLRVEIKTAPTYLNDFFTFKVSSLRTCVQKNSVMLLFPKAAPHNYYLIWPKQAVSLLADFPHKIYKGFSPNDQAIRIKYFQYIEYLDGPKRWCSKALRYIYNNKDVLLKDR
jgi:hypothetical protein